MDIVDEIRNDAEKGAKRLEAEYRNGLMTLARRFCHDPGDAAELVNRTFAEVIANIDNYAEQSAFFAWMSKILVNINAKDNRRKANGDIVYPGIVPEMADEDAEEEIFRNLDHSLLRDAIDTLPADIKKTLLLHYFMDMPVKDIAKFMALPSGTVMWRLHYARQMLAAKLGVAAEKAKNAAKKPGTKATLLALALCALTAAGAVGIARWGELSERAAAIFGSGGVAPSATAPATETSGHATSDTRHPTAKPESRIPHNPPTSRRSDDLTI